MRKGIRPDHPVQLPSGPDPKPPTQRCAWRVASLEELQKFDALNAVMADPIITSAVGALVE